MQVRPAKLDDREQLLQLWERAVRATHQFLEHHDVVALRSLVAEALASDPLTWWVLASTENAPVGFLGFANDAIEALFIHPSYHRRGGGRLLVAHAQGLSSGALTVDVNEQNLAALRFYEALGFAVVGRSLTDGGGRPFPLLHMKRESLRVPPAVLDRPTLT